MTHPAHGHDHSHGDGHGHSHSHGDGRDHGPGDTHDDAFASAKASYPIIFVIIAALIFGAIGVSFANLGGWAVVVSLLIAGTQASLLAYFFMHLKQSDKLTWLVALAGLFWIFILFCLMLTDYVTRHIAAY